MHLLELIQLQEHLKNLNDEIYNVKSFEPNNYEEKLLEKYLNGQKIIESNKKLELHKIPFYLYEPLFYFILIGANNDDSKLNLLKMVS